MKIAEITETEIKFDNGSWLKYHHDQACCEHVYADFEHLNTYNVLPHTGERITIFEIDFPEDIGSAIEGIQGEGFTLQAKDESKWFVPCHNCQNGYYSSDLTLKWGPSPEGEKDISEFVLDDIG